jgi:hypothetical protein
MPSRKPMVEIYGNCKFGRMDAIGEIWAARGERREAVVVVVVVGVVVVCQGRANDAKQEPHRDFL